MVSNFQNVLSQVGLKPNLGVSQNELRHYSEEFSRLTALWLKDRVEAEFPDLKILRPEAKVNTIYGTGFAGKSLDVAGVTDRDYLAVDFSIKTFNFKDRRTKNYRKNYTGRFYELLGEELDLRRSYEQAILVALILLPKDSQTDSDPSSFALAVKQFSKAAKQPTQPAAAFGFEFVFVGFHDANGIEFFNALVAPPRQGIPNANDLLSADEMLQEVKNLYEARKSNISIAPLPAHIPFKFA